MKSNNNYKITLRMQMDLKERIKLFAKRNHISMNEQMIEMLEYACTQFIIKMAQETEEGGD